MRHFIVLLASTLFCACGGGNGGAKSVGIIWSTSELVLKYTPATKTSVEVSFTSDTDLGTTETRVTSELDPFMVVGIPGSEEVVAGVNTALDVIVLLESNDTPGVVMGDIELVQNGTVIAQLPVMLELTDDTFTVSSAGGTFSGTRGVELIVPAGALSEDTSVAVRIRDDLGDVDGHTPPGGYEPLAYMELNTYSAAFSGPVDISVPKPEGASVDDTFIVTFLTPDHQERFVDIAEIDGDRLVSRQSTHPFTGIIESGIYILYRVLIAENGYVEGLITDENGLSVSGAVCTVNTSPFTTTSNPLGRYVCFVPHGNVVVSAVDPVTQAFASGVSFTSLTQLVATLDLQLRSVDASPIGGLSNWTFSEGLKDWQTEGAVDVVSNLGPIVPGFDGVMVMLSTGTGAVDGRRSVIRQTFRMPECPDDNPIIEIVVRYQFVSEEYNEFVGTAFNDQMLITLSSPVLPTIKQLAVADVNSSTFDFIDGVDFPGGDNTTGATGWLLPFYFYPGLSGTIATVEISVEDNGDDIYDSVALLNAVDIRCLESSEPTASRFLSSPIYYAGRDGYEGLVTNSLFDHDPAVRSTTIFTTATSKDECRRVLGTKYKIECLWDETKSGTLPSHYNRKLNRKDESDEFYLAYDNHRGIDFRTVKYPPTSKPGGGKYDTGFTYVCAAHGGWMYGIEGRFNTVIIEGSGEATGYTSHYLHLCKRLFTGADREAQRDVETDSEIIALLTDLEPKTRKGVVGYIVEAGQIIGVSGDAGAEENPHLHFVVRNTDDMPVDPFGWDGDDKDDPNTDAPSYYLWKSSVVFAANPK